MIEYKVGINFRECGKIGRSVVGRTPNKCVERRQYNIVLGPFQKKYFPSPNQAY